MRKSPRAPKSREGNFFRFERVEGTPKKARDSRVCVGRGRAWDVRRPKRAKSPPWTNHLGSKKGNGSTCGRKPLKRSLKAVMVLGGNVRAERWIRKDSSIMGGEKSSEGRNPRA